MKICKREHNWDNETHSKCPECRQMWYNANREQFKIYNRQRRYGLNSENYTVLLEKQKYSCAICKDKAELEVDHCHTTSKVRGLLCERCNRLLGLGRENIDILVAAIDYLKSVK